MRSGLYLRVKLDSGLGYPSNDNHACIHGIRENPQLENVMRRAFHASIYPCGSRSNDALSRRYILQ